MGRKVQRKGNKAEDRNGLTAAEARAGSSEDGQCSPEMGLGRAMVEESDTVIGLGERCSSYITSL